MTRYRFWILFGACVVAAGAVWFLSVPKKLDQIEARASDLHSLAQRADDLAPRAVGAKTLGAQEFALNAARKDLGDLQSEFLDRDAQNLDLWFPELKTSWARRPSAVDFKRYYLVSTDDLRRVLVTAAEQLGAKSAVAALIEYSWMKGDELPPPADLRDLQREFWVQDRLFRAAARYGALPVKPMEVGAAETAVGLGKRLFARRPYRLFMEVPTVELRRLLHAFDGPFKDPSAARIGGTVGMRVLVNQVGVSRLKLDRDVAEGLSRGTRVQVTFDLTVLDFELPKEG
ncbi:MAG: hypothetical protein V3W41_01375 [Planctomycetota bacterium]